MVRSFMPTITEVKELAFALPEPDRARLASDLLASLSTAEEDVDDDEYAEALRRLTAYKVDPSRGMTLEEFEQSMLEPD